MTGEDRPVLIAVDGLSGAGKTTLAVELAALLRQHLTVSLFHLEDIYPGWDGLGVGMERYVQLVLRPLSENQSAHWRAWDWEANADGDPHRSEPADVVLVEGVGAACAAARGILDAAIWVEAPGQLRRRMAMARDGVAYEPFWDRWAAQESQWLNADHVPAHVDLTVSGHCGQGTPPMVLKALAGLPALQYRLGHLAQAAPRLQVSRLAGTPDASALFASLYADSANAAWLDSSDASERSDRSRFSIMADDGGRFGRIVRHDGGVTVLAQGPVTSRIRGPFFRWLEGVWGTSQVNVPADYPCEFSLGWLGYLGYELKRETGGADVPGEAGIPDAGLIFAGRAVVLDHLEGTAYVLTLTDGTPDEETDAWLKDVRSALSRPGRGQARGGISPGTTFTVSDSRPAYLAKIAAAQEQIRDGNSYEICLTTALTARAGTIDPLAVYCSLRRGSPAPFASYLRFGDLHIAGSSPERFLSISSGGALRAEPIKGTRRRIGDPAADARLRNELAGSPKDRAENIMIVDLLRNDLSHFAVPGTLSVSRLCAIETYAGVHQMVSTIDARLRPGASRAETIAAAFPAGSMTGAPKISTMAILDRLETGPRGVYSGAVGFLSLNGAAELSVVIRSLVMHRRNGSFDLSLGVGGAITADSVPREEWEEVRIKANSVLRAIGAQFPADAS